MDGWTGELFGFEDDHNTIFFHSICGRPTSRGKKRNFFALDSFG